MGRSGFPDPRVEPTFFSFWWEEEGPNIEKNTTPVTKRLQDNTICLTPPGLPGSSNHRLLRFRDQKRRATCTMWSSATPRAISRPRPARNRALVGQRGRQRLNKGPQISSNRFGFPENEHQTPQDPEPPRWFTHRVRKAVSGRALGVRTAGAAQSTLSFEGAGVALGAEFATPWTRN